MAWAPPSKIGDSDPSIIEAKKILAKYSYGKAANDGSPIYTKEFGEALVQYARNVNDAIDAGKRGGPRPEPPAFDWKFKEQLGMIQPTPKPPPQAGYRRIWIYTAPGSGAEWWIGPSFEVGEWCKNVLRLNHQPIGYPKGGYMGLLGGDPGLSYNEVIAAEGAELERLLSTNPDIHHPDVEFWFSGYSQSADGMKVAVNRLFGDGGKFAHLRPRINGLLLFGDPTRQPGPTKVGNNPPGWGISRKVFPRWLNDLTWSITTETPHKPDMYACTTDDTALPLFYEWFVKAETSASFIAYSAGIIIPAIASYLGLGALFMGPLIAGATGMSLQMASQLINAMGGNPKESPNPELVHKLSAQYLLTPQGLQTLFNTLAALPGIQTHGEYHLPKPEFGGRTGIQVACDVVAAFRRT